ncbi:MAG TPA: pseudouridine synthase [Deltaproteobacteria bacterium]|nr:pseudouridine synthase [Deltaproteobacteria bacterium]
MTSLLPVVDSSAVRIQKVMAQAGIASRRAAEKMILEGIVSLNGQTVTELGQRMVPGRDHLVVDGKKVRLPEVAQRKVYALYKPKNCITSLSDPEGRRTIVDYFPRKSQRLFPVGRLDYDAEGLLLLTNDGEFAHLIMHPRFKIAKSYFVKVRGLIQFSEMEPLRRGPVIDGRSHMPVQSKILHQRNDKTWLEVILHEGTNQQIKKMFLGLGYPVLKIKRFRIGSIGLETLRPGEHRILSKKERQQLLDLAGSPI